MDLPFDLDREVVQLITSKSVELPTYPGVALKLQRLIGGDDYGLDVLTRLVMADQSLATNVMRAANSAFYGSAPSISTLGPAISRIGAKELGNIAIAGTLGLTSTAEGPLASLRKSSWRASLVGALLCQELARARHLDPGEAFLSGLLHDFGETIAYACFEVFLERHPDSTPQDAASWLAAGQRYHVELGMALAADWKLPEFVVEAVMRHHDADLSLCQHRAQVEVVALSDAICPRVLAAASVEDAHLEQVVGLSVTERDRLNALLPRVPGFLMSFDDAAVSPQSLDEPSLVTQPPTTLDDPHHPVNLQVSVLKQGHAERYRGVEWAPTGLRMTGGTPQAERRLVVLEFDKGLKINATVTLCTAAGRGWVLELKPFAMDRAAQASWAKLGEPPAPPPAPPPG